MSSSPIDTTIAFLYAQTNHAARIAHELVVAPQAGAAMARLQANETVREKEKKVPTAEKGDKSKLNADKDGKQGRFAGRRRMAPRQPEQLQEEPENAESMSTNDEFLSGNLLNIKV